MVKKNDSIITRLDGKAVGGLKKWSIGMKVLSWYHLRYSSHWSSMVSPGSLLSAGPIPPTGPGLMKGKPMMDSWRVLGMMEDRYSQADSRGVMKTKAGTFGRL